MKAKRRVTVKDRKLETMRGERKTYKVQSPDSFGIQQYFEEVAKLDLRYNAVLMAPEVRARGDTMPNLVKRMETVEPKEWSSLRQQAAFDNDLREMASEVVLYGTGKQPDNSKEMREGFVPVKWDTKNWHSKVQTAARHVEIFDPWEEFKSTWKTGKKGEEFVVKTIRDGFKWPNGSPSDYEMRAMLHIHLSMLARMTDPGCHLRVYTAMIGETQIGKSSYISASLPDDCRSMYMDNMNPKKDLERELRRANGQKLIEIKEAHKMKSDNWEAIATWLDNKDDHQLLLYIQQAEWIRRNFTVVFTLNEQSPVPNLKHLKSRLAVVKLLEAETGGETVYNLLKTDKNKALFWGGIESFFDDKTMDPCEFNVRGKFRKERDSLYDSISEKTKADDVVVNAASKLDGIAIDNAATLSALLQFCGLQERRKDEDSGEEVLRLTTGIRDIETKFKEAISDLGWHQKVSSSGNPVTKMAVPGYANKAVRAWIGPEGDKKPKLCYETGEQIAEHLGYRRRGGDNLEDYLDKHGD